MTNTHKPLPLSVLRSLDPGVKQILFDMAEVYLDVTDASPEGTRSEYLQAARTIAESVMLFTRVVPFKKTLVPTWTPNWTDGLIKMEIPAYNGQSALVDLPGRLNDFLLRHNKNPEDWEIKSAKLDRDTRIITMYATDVALKARNERKRQRLLKYGTRKGRKKNPKQAISPKQAAKALSTEQLLEMAKSRGMDV